jgi:hypothetical protein
MTEGLLILIAKEIRESVPHDRPRRGCSDSRCKSCKQASEAAERRQARAWRAWVKSWEGHGGWAV